MPKSNTEKNATGDNDMTKHEILLKRDGHHKAANFVEKKAKRAGKGTKLYNQYLHHVEKWLEYDAMLEALNA